MGVYLYRCTHGNVEPFLSHTDASSLSVAISMTYGAKSATLPQLGVLLITKPTSRCLLNAVYRLIFQWSQVCTNSC